jgi:hypothetical protein
MHVRPATENQFVGKATEKGGLCVGSRKNGEKSPGFKIKIIYIYHQTNFYPDWAKPIDLEIIIQPQHNLVKLKIDRFSFNVEFISLLTFVSVSLMDIFLSKTCVFQVLSETETEAKYPPLFWERKMNFQ